MTETYHKLVRDRIPEIIQADGKECVIEVMTELEFQQALRQKLVEEAQEAATASSENLIQELADLYEVIDTLMATQQINSETVLGICGKIKSQFV